MGCISCGVEDDLRQVLENILQNDSSEKIQVVVPCDSGGKCAREMEKFLELGSSRIKLTGMGDHAFPKFRSNFLEATGNEVVEEWNYGDNVATGFKLIKKYPDDIKKLQDKIKTMRKSLN